MEHVLLHFMTVFAGLFAIMNPVANTPIFIGLTEGNSQATKKAIARNSVILAFLVVVLFCVAGRLIFDLFGITLPALRITGGILVFLIGFHMLHGEPSVVHNPSPEDNQKSLDAELSISVSPLAVPILAGPGTITTAMNFVSQGGLEQHINVFVAFSLLCALTYLFFISGGRLLTYIGESTIKVVTRMMGLILAVIGTQMFIQGVREALQPIA